MHPAVYVYSHVYIHIYIYIYINITHLRYIMMSLIVDGCLHVFTNCLIVVIPNLQCSGFCSKLSRPAGDRLTAHTCARNETEMKILSTSNFLGSRWKGPLVWDLECCVARNGPHTLACFKMLVQVFSRGLDTLLYFGKTSRRLRY